MLKKFKIASIAFILVLFGFSLITVSPVLAADGDGFTVCDNMPEAASKLSCFKDLARSLREAVEEAANASRSQEAVVDQAVIQSADAEGANVALKLQIEEINGWLNDKDARIAELLERVAIVLSLVSSKQAELDAAYFAESSELQAKDATIAELQSQLTAATEAKESQQATPRCADDAHQQSDFCQTVLTGIELVTPLHRFVVCK